jgi:secreted Zn-dependent insulinase-like peptidase
MPLPTIETPTYELKMPSSGKKIKYRPFLVKEEKILIIALESKNQNEITNAVKDVLKKCILTRGVKVDDLPTFDIEYIFLNIRAKSIGEDIRLTVTCPDDRETQVPVTIYVDEIKVTKPEGHTNDVVIDDKLTLRMKYPSLNQFVENNFEVDDDPEVLVNKTFKVVADCMDTVFTEEDAWEAKDYTSTERVKFVEQLNSKQYKKVENFFATMPKLSHTIEVVNPNTKKKSSIVLEGLADFFG